MFSRPSRKSYDIYSCLHKALLLFLDYYAHPLSHVALLSSYLQNGNNVCHLKNSPRAFCLLCCRWETVESLPLKAEKQSDADASFPFVFANSHYFVKFLEKKGRDRILLKYGGEERDRHKGIVPFFSSQSKNHHRESWTGGFIV